MWTERSMMIQFHSPFLLDLKHCFQSFHECYLVTSYMEGSDLTHYSRSHFFLDEFGIRFYFCQLICAVEALHKLKIVHRDVKPRNMLIAIDGNMKLCDFGLSHQFRSNDEWISTPAGTDSYCAPEMVARQAYRFSVDLWSMGITLYELLCQKRPFRSDNHMREMFRKGLGVDFTRGKPCSPVARDLISALLTQSPRNRLGCGPRGMIELKEHCFFDGVDWEAVETNMIPPPYQPTVDGGHTKKVDDNVFDEEFDSRQVSLTSWEQQKFKDIEYNVEPDQETMRKLMEFNKALVDPTSGTSYSKTKSRKSKYSRTSKTLGLKPEKEGQAKRFLRENVRERREHSI
eukprot:412148_1